jgi:uncharacterized protein (TIGR00730 family)
MSHKKELVSPITEHATQIMSEMVHAAETLASVGPAISIFGSARIKRDSPYFALSETIAAQLAKAGFAIIAGGGPGIMEAANKGAFEAGGASIGLHITLPKESKRNEFLTTSLAFRHFVSRKSTFFMHSAGYVVLPGGFGTLDELFEAVTLMQTGKIPTVRRSFLVGGQAFWGGTHGLDQAAARANWAGQQSRLACTSSSRMIQHASPNISKHSLHQHPDSPDSDSPTSPYKQ